VDAQEIDSLYYENSHYLEPEELGVKPFSLLKEVLTKTNRAGIAKISFQRREHLCALEPLGNIMALHTLYYQDEIVDHKELGPPKQQLASSELEMATSLVKAMTIAFEPEKYKDEYHDALKKLVAAKLKGVEVKAPEETKAEIEDLMSALKESLAAARKKKSVREKVAA
jgi:DNA end-binding protein Ku